MGCNQSVEKQLRRLDTQALLNLPRGFRSSATIIRQDDIVDYLSDKPTSPKSSHEFFFQEPNIPTNSMPEGTLFEDSTFQARDEAIGLQEEIADLAWMRPSELCENPKLFVDGVSRADVKQGVLGDCWLLSACAAVATRLELLERVVNSSQPLLGPLYSGQLTFRFWSFGELIEVTIDDRLPTVSGKLIFASCTHPQEFWLPLLEKAFAKLHGSYSALQGGHSALALADLTGGIAERLLVKNCSFQEVETIFQHGAFVTCAGNCSNTDVSGLVQGHAYTLTGVGKVAMLTGGEAKLMRLRSPWADAVEWKGSWSDRSIEWELAEVTDKERLRLKALDDGEFWMEFDDFQKQFEELTVATVGPDFDRDGCSDSPRQSAAMRGTWTPTSAGGSRNNLEMFQHNPQYLLTIQGNDTDSKVSILVGLMQQPEPHMLPIAFFIYKTETPGERLHAEYFLCTPDELSSGAFTDSLEVIARASLCPGHYVIIPATFQPHCHSEYLLRVYALQPFTISQIEDPSEAPIWES